MFSRLLRKAGHSVAGSDTGSNAMIRIPFNRRALLVALVAIATPAAAAELNLRGSLAGTNVVSATESPATGEVAAVLEDDNDLRVDMIYSGMATNATGAALHVGKAGENGTRIAPLAISTGTTEGQLRGAVVRLTPQVAAQVRTGQAYVQIVSLDEPDGVVRAQLNPQPTSLSASAVANASATTTPSTASTSATSSASRSAVDGRATGTTTVTPTNPVNDDDRDSDDD